jgi:hypothetical protein
VRKGVLLGTTMRRHVSGRNDDDDGARLTELLTVPTKRYGSGTLPMMGVEGRRDFMIMLMTSVEIGEEGGQGSLFPWWESKAYGTLRSAGSSCSMSSCSKETLVSASFITMLYRTFRVETHVIYGPRTFRPS